MGSTEQNLRRWWLVIVAIVAVVLGGAGAIAYHLIAKLRSTHEHAMYERAEALRNAEAISTAIYKRSSSARGYLLSGDPTFLEARNAARTEVMRRLPRLVVGEEGATREAANRITELIARHDAASERVVGLYASSVEQARRTWDGEARPLQMQIETHINEVVAAQRVGFENARTAASAATRSARQLLLALLIAVAVVVSTLIYAYARALRSLVVRIEEEQQQVTFRLIEQVPVGIFVITPDGKPYYANQHAKLLLGRGVERGGELAKTYRTFEAGSGRTYPEERLPITRALAGEISEVTDIEIHRDDDIIPLHVVAAPVHDSRGKIIYAVAGFQDVRELQRVAMRDALTGLVNRAAVQQMFTREHLTATRAGRPLSLALIDLDRFKSVNDTHGHAAGDEVLRRTAEALSATFRRTDILGRWGGEELVVIMPDTDLAAATRALERALEATRALVFRGKDEQRYSVTFSAGVVLVTASDKLDSATSRADRLLYAAKEGGRDRVVAA